MTWMADALRAGGLDVIEQSGWKTRGHGAMGQVLGVLAHHTAGGGSNDWRIVQDGRPDLAGPLAHMTLERDGTFRLLAAGQCWHAGAGGPLLGVGKNNGNEHLIGIEGVSNGTTWTDAQRDAYPRGVAALLRYLELPAAQVAGHKEWAPGRKVDPGNWSMADFRAAVARHITGSAPSPTSDSARRRRTLALD
nr:N-acetylmuramoyl-L-alanine amidase [Actinomycetospora corticicola]